MKIKIAYNIKKPQVRPLVENHWNYSGHMSVIDFIFKLEFGANQSY